MTALRMARRRRGFGLALVLIVLVIGGIAVVFAADRARLGYENIRWLNDVRAARMAARSAASYLANQGPALLDGKELTRDVALGDFIATIHVAAVQPAGILAPGPHDRQRRVSLMVRPRTPGDAAAASSSPLDRLRLRRTRTIEREYVALFTPAEPLRLMLLSERTGQVIVE